VHRIAAMHLQLGQTLGDDGRVTIEGWSALDVSLVIATILVAVGILAWCVNTKRVWLGMAVSGFLLIAMGVLWFDNYAVSRIFGISNCIGCIGDWGKARQYITHAGWLYALAAGVIVLYASRLRGMQSLEDGRDSAPSLSL
jgi:hypothetical protein